MLPLASAWSLRIPSWISDCTQVRKARTFGASLHSKPCSKGSDERRRRLQVSCCSSYDDGDRGKSEEGESSWSIEGEVDKILSDEALMRDLTAAVERVTKARQELDALEEQQKQASVSESLDAANSLVESCQRDVFAAELDLKNAEIALVKARAGMADILGEEAFDKDVERVESAKAAGVSGMVGLLAGLPFLSLAGDKDGIDTVLSAGIVLLSCALFGLTYRYAVRRDLSNTQLRAGCVAAFTLVRCFAQVDAARFTDISQQETAQRLLLGGLFAAESVAIFSFAAVSLEYCFQQGIVSPFPSKLQQ